MYVGSTQSTMATCYTACVGKGEATGAVKGGAEAGAKGVEARDGGADRVTISAEGQRAYQTEMDSVESFRVPNWMPELTPSLKIDGEKLGEEMHAYWGMIGGMTADGVFSEEEKTRSQEILQGLPIRKEMMDHHDFSLKFKNEIEEYQGIFSQLYDEAKGELGIDSREDYVRKVLDAPGDNSELRNRLVGKLLDNPRAVELMGALGIERPSLS